MARIEKIYQDFHKKTVQKNFPFTNFIYAIFLVNATVIVLVLVFKRFLPPVIPLFYGFAEGEQQLATSTQLIIPSFLSIAFLIINLIVAFFMKNDFIKKVLVLTPFVATFFSIITTIEIFFLVGNF